MVREMGGVQSECVTEACEVKVRAHKQKHLSEQV
jgi:hypothetical protein